VGSGECSQTAPGSCQAKLRAAPQVGIDVG
jgi:hypothetical protein